MNIIQVNDNDLKKKITEDILRDIPHWFAYEDSIIKYINTMDDKGFFVSTDKDEYIGFFSINYLNDDVADLYVLGIKKDCHRKKIGTKIFNHVQKHLIDCGYKYITVQTLSSKSTDEYYARTRKFYHKMGFVEAYENEKVYDENNPFLLMVKHIG